MRTNRERTQHKSRDKEREENKFINCVLLCVSKITSRTRKERSFERALNTSLLEHKRLVSYLNHKPQPMLWQVQKIRSVQASRVSLQVTSKVLQFKWKKSMKDWYLAKQIKPIDCENRSFCLNVKLTRNVNHLRTSGKCQVSKNKEVLFLNIF